MTALEPAQSALLDAVCAGPLLDAAALEAAGALAAPPAVDGARRGRAGRSTGQGDLFG